MLKLMKQMLALLCVTAVCCLMFPAWTASAATSGDFGYSLLSDGTANITAYTGTQTELVIPTTIDGYTVTKINWYAFANNTTLESVVIPEGVTTIECNAFEKCTSLKSVSIPRSVTAINGQLFIGNPFNGCTALEGIDIDDENEVYCDIDGVVYSKDQTTLVLCPSGKAGEYIIPDGVTAIEDTAFSSCVYLTSVTLPTSLAHIGLRAFSDCIALASVTIPAGVEMIRQETFSGCTALTSISLPESVTSIEQQAFSGCASLANITIGKSINELGSNAFDGTAYMNNTENWQNNVLYIGEYLIKADRDLQGRYAVLAGTKLIATKAFYDCDKLTDIVLPNSMKTIGVRAFEDCSFLKTVVIPESVVRIEERAFSKCTLLDWIIIPDSVTAIDDTAFEHCGSLGIYGYAGSYAQLFAMNNNIFFYAAPKPSALGDLNSDGNVDVNDLARVFDTNAALKSYYKGDIDGDWKVSTADARTILMDLLSDGNASYNAVADFDQNGTVNTTDARELLVDVINGASPAFVTPPNTAIEGMPAGESVAFSQTASAELWGGDVTDDECHVVQSLDELKAFYADDEGWEDYTASYTEDFFRANALVLVKVSAPSLLEAAYVSGIVKSNNNALTVHLVEEYKARKEPIIYHKRMLLEVSKADLIDVAKVCVYVQKEFHYELL